MSRFNLLDEAWISVVYDEKGATKDVSLIELFSNAHQYKDLAGDMKTQDFAVLRVLLAVLHTVFSRFDADGHVYEYLEVDERFKQIEPVDEDDSQEYEEVLYDTWIDLWKRQKFPEIVNQYLEKWRDRFYLFDEEYPFFQVRKEDIEKAKVLKNGAQKIFGKNFNRTISESSNKTALFSPKNENKEQLTAAELIRWLLTYHGYSETGPMNTIGDKEHSKGILFNLGGLYLKGATLFETLLMNLTLFDVKYLNHLSIQKPCWELLSNEIIEQYVIRKQIDNLASLYTSWSKGVYIDPKVDLQKFECRVAKIPAIDQIELFLEPMTLWSFEKERFYPRLHDSQQALWRSFGAMVSINYRESNHIPGIIDWQHQIKSMIGNKSIKVCSVGMVSDQTANNTPIMEVFDTLDINEFILTDVEEGGWIYRISEEVDRIKNVISKTYSYFIIDVFDIKYNIREKDLKKIRSSIYRGKGIDSHQAKQMNAKIEELYFQIDQPFRQWLSSIRPGDEKDLKVKEWRSLLKKLVKAEAENVLSQCGTRDYLGIEKDGHIKNIATVYNSFDYWLHQQLK